MMLSRFFIDRDEDLIRSFYRRAAIGIEFIGKLYRSLCRDSCSMVIILEVAFEWVILGVCHYR